MKQQRISVVLCTYNGGRYLREQLDTIVHQSLPIYELIVQDDASTDDTCAVVAEYAERYPYIRLEQNRTQKGINVNFFDALSKASGEYIAISDQDDRWEIDKLRWQMDAIGDKLLVSGRSKPFADNGVAVSYDTRKPNYSLLRMLFVGSLSGHTLLFRRKLLDLLPDISAEIWAIRYYDVILSMVAASYDSIAYVDKVLVHQRRYVEASTYAEPVDNRKSLRNVWNHLTRTYLYYKELKPEMEHRFSIMYRFLLAIDRTESKQWRNAVKMAYLQSRRGGLNYCRLTWQCVKHFNELFYTNEGSGWLRWIRSFYFPISCSDYFRYLSRNFVKPNN